jgi:hypothetical protein
MMNDDEVANSKQEKNNGEQGEAQGEAQGKGIQHDERGVFEGKLTRDVRCIECRVAYKRAREGEVEGRERETVAHA